MEENPMPTETLQAPPLDTLLHDARSVGPLLRAHASDAEGRGALTDESVRALSDAGLLKLWRPRSLGGSELDPVSHAILSEEIARFDPAAAWLVMAASNAAFDLRMAPDRFVEAVYDDNPDALV
jgi:alkylation response protein AidB-like acyl-CoA dehydrogenase